MEDVTYRPIGVIQTPFKNLKEIPIQPTFAEGVEGRIELNLDMVQGLTDLKDFSHIILVYHFHLSDGYDLMAKPFLDSQRHGVFSIRGPRRPNPIGISTVRLLEVKGNVVRFAGADMADGTPLLDIKPYVPAFDSKAIDRIGWLEGKLPGR